MPFLSYQVSEEEAVRNAGRFVKEARADCVKLEGGVTQADKAEAIVRAGIPVMGHIGLTPQTATQLGGFKVQGRDPKAAKRLLEDARALEAAGAFSIVLECVPSDLAAEITQRLSIPTIGIGAGPRCDGQVLVLHDLVGLFERFTPKFVKQYAHLSQDIGAAVEAYRAEVESGAFPAKEHEFGG
jgi:3-methyl-2-oxobutanoate hydroxymethyltransferase